MVAVIGKILQIIYAVVTKNAKENTTVVGVPGKEIWQDGETLGR